jgi:hypothetical protein
LVDALQPMPSQYVTTSVRALSMRAVDSAVISRWGMLIAAGMCSRACAARERASITVTCSPASRATLRSHASIS